MIDCLICRLQRSYRIYGISTITEVILKNFYRKNYNLPQVIQHLYCTRSTLKGSAKLEAPYDVHSCIEFIACNGGHIKVKGNIHNGGAYGYKHELVFENELDQTYLKSFVKDLFADFEKYAER